jgi:hypothetical protein
MLSGSLRFIFFIPVEKGNKKNRSNIIFIHTVSIAGLAGTAGVLTCRSIANSEFYLSLSVFSV